VFEDHRRGFVVLDYSGYPGTPSKLVIYFTVDSGQTWQALKVLEAVWGERGIPFAIADSAIIVSTGSRDRNVTVTAVPLDSDSFGREAFKGRDPRPHIRRQNATGG
jgi:hypothetical protein